MKFQIQLLVFFSLVALTTQAGLLESLLKPLGTLAGGVDGTVDDLLSAVGNLTNNLPLTKVLGSVTGLVGGLVTPLVTPLTNAAGAVASNSDVGLNVHIPLNNAIASLVTGATSTVSNLVKSLLNGDISEMADKVLGDIVNTFLGGNIDINQLLKGPLGAILGGDDITDIISKYLSGGIGKRSIRFFPISNRTRSITTTQAPRVVAAKLASVLDPSQLLQTIIDKLQSIVDSKKATLSPDALKIVEQIIADLNKVLTDVVSLLSHATDAVKQELTDLVPGLSKVLTLINTLVGKLGL